MQRFLLLLLLTTATQTLPAQSCNLDFEDWETATNANPPTGWQRINSYVGSGSSNSYSGSRFAGLNTLGDQWIVEPLTCPGEVCFWWRASGGSSDYDVDIDWSADGGTTWTTAQTVALTGSGSPTAYAQMCVDLPEESYPAPFEGVLIRFHQSRRVGGSFYFDDVCVSSGTCTVAPTQLTFSEVQAGCLQRNTPFSVTVCATDAGENTATGFSGNITVSGSGLSGTVTQATTGGCAQFTDLQINAAGNYMLSASGGGLLGNSPTLTIAEQCNATENLTVVAYNLLNFPNGRDDCGTDNTVVPARWDTLRTVMEYVQPDVLMVCELQTEAGADLILSDALNVNGISHYARANFVLNQSPGGTALNNAFFYNTNKMTLCAQDEVATNVRDIGAYTVFLNDPNLAITEDTTFIDFYAAHFKAGDGASNESSRATQCTALQNHIAAKSSERNAVVGGDFNFYTSTEPGYQTLLSGTRPFNDPAGRPGSWNDNAAFQDVHTQSTRNSGLPPLDCGATGGMDSRFDFLLASNPVMSGTQNVAFVPGSYAALGNDGNLFNDAITDPSNTTTVPRDVLFALRNMSDHLPIIMDLQVTYPLAPLAIDLLYFDAERVKDNAVLTWETAAQTDAADYFTLQKSPDARTFIDLADLEINAAHFYQYADALQNGTNYYRLKMTERDGSISYSAVKSIEKAGQDWAVYPNPTRGVLHIRSLSENSFNAAEVRIFDAFGRLVYEGKSDAQTGFVIETNAWQPGVFTSEILVGQERVTRRVVKVGF